MIRLFIALDIPDEIKEEIIVIRNSVISNPLDYKWEAKGKLHITLKFIGEVKDDLLEPIKNEIEFISNYKPVISSFTKFGFFFSRGRPVILWLGFKLSGEIFHLEKELNNKLLKFGIEKEKRDFKPHLTLMRIRKKVSKDFISSFENCKLPGTEFKIDSVSLIKSELNPKLPDGRAGSSIYTTIKKYNLMGGL